MSSRSSWMDTANKFIYATTTGIMITPYKSNFNPAFESIHSIKKYKQHYMTPFTGFYHSKNHCYVCSNMNPDYVKTNFFPDYNIVKIPAVIPKKAYPIQFNDDNIVLRESQSAFIEETLYEENVHHKHRIFNNLQTGLGKTAATIYMAAIHGTKIIVISYMERILKQWKTSFQEFTNIDPRRICIISGSKELYKMSNDPSKASDYDVFILTHSLITSFANKFGWMELSNVFCALGIGVKIFDEAHRNLESMIAVDAYTSVEYTYYLSADFNQSTDQKAKKYDRAFWGVPVIPANKNVRSLHYIDVLSLSYNSHPTIADKLGVITKMGFNNFNYMRYQFSNKAIFEYLDYAVNYFYNDTSNYYANNGRLLILTSLIEHIKVIYDHIIEKYTDIGKSIGMYYGDLDETEKDRVYKNCDIIIATYSSFMVGIDAKNITGVISCDQIDRLSDNQAAGRARPQPNRKALYVMLFDNGFDKCRRSKNIREDYLRQSKASKFIDVDFSK